MNDQGSQARRCNAVYAFDPDSDKSMGALMRRSISLLGLCLVLVLDWSSAHAQALQKVTLRIDWTALGYHAPFYLGVAKGYYRDAGLDVQILEGKGSPNTITLVGNGSDNFGFADVSTAAQLISKGAPVKAVMGIFQRSTLAIFFPKNHGLTVPTDLKGKRIVMCTSDGGMLYLPGYLKAIGLSKDDVKIVVVDCGIKYSYLAQGGGDAVISYGTAGRPLMQNVGMKDVGKFDFADAGIFLPSHGIIASDSEIADNPDMVRRFVSATAKSWLAARAAPDQAVAAEVAAMPLLQGKEDSIRSTLEDSFDYLETPGTKGEPFGWQSKAEWDKAVANLVQYTDMPQPKSADIFFTNAFIGSK
jgi:NitT/TauT family transport system substrate-binding protein